MAHAAAFLFSPLNASQLLYSDGGLVSSPIVLPDIQLLLDAFEVTWGVKGRRSVKARALPKTCMMAHS